MSDQLTQPWFGSPNEHSHRGKPSTRKLGNASKAEVRYHSSSLASSLVLSDLRLPNMFYATDDGKKHRAGDKGAPEMLAGKNLSERFEVIKLKSKRVKQYTGFGRYS